MVIIFQGNNSERNQWSSCDDSSHGHGEGGSHKNLIFTSHVKYDLNARIHNKHKQTNQIFFNNNRCLFFVGWTYRNATNAAGERWYPPRIGIFKRFRQLRSLWHSFIAAFFLDSIICHSRSSFNHLVMIVILGNACWTLNAKVRKGTGFE